MISESPKNYAYKVREESGEEFSTCKVRGLTLNYESSKLINFNSIKNFVLSENPNPISVTFPSKIARQAHYTVVTKPLTKKYNRIPSKRRVLEDYSSLPFGYVE